LPPDAPAIPPRMLCAAFPLPGTIGVPLDMLPPPSGPPNKPSTAGPANGPSRISAGLRRPRSKSLGVGIALTGSPLPHSICERAIDSAPSAVTSAPIGTSAAVALPGINPRAALTPVRAVATAEMP
jgi:hypothetical protein